MNIKQKNYLKKFFAIIISVFVLNSFVLNDYAFAFVQQPVMPTVNSLQQNFLNIDSTNAKITDGFMTESIDDNDLVIFIQDLHGNPSVQKNISEIIKDLDKNYGIDTILLEGIPEGQADLTVLQELKKYNVADALLKSNVLTGPEYYLMQNNTNAKICGLENWSLYINNIKRNARILQDNQYLTETFIDFENNLFSKIDNIKKLQEYIKFDLSDERLLKVINQPIINYDELHKYISICNDMNTINKKRLNSEYSAFIGDLKNDLDIKEYTSLINDSKKENLIDYYNNLYNKISAEEKYVNKYNELYLFLKYTTEKSELNLVSLISQQNKFFNNYLSSLSNNRTQQNLFVLKMTQLFKDFVFLSISDEDYNFFIENYEKYINLLPNYLAQDYYDYEDLLFDDLLFEYHKTNIDRNKIFVDNIIESLSKKNIKNKLTVVVAGGFHNSIAQDLKNKNISYLFVTPNIQGQTTNTFYNEIVSSTDKSALAPIKIMLANTGLLQDNTISVFFEYLVNALASVNDYSPEKIEQELSSVIQKSTDEISSLFGIIPISVKRTNSTFTVDIDGQELKFKTENGQIIWEKSSINYNNYIEQQEKKQLVEKLISLLRKYFGIFQATSMKLNPKLKYSSRFFSKRLGKNKSFLFNLSMFFSAIKKYPKAYGLMMDYASSYTNKDNVVSYSINFNDDSFRDMRSRIEFAPFMGKSITILVEKGLEQYLTEDTIKELLKESIKRTGETEAIFKDTLFIGFLDKSTNLFEDHLNNGFIGVNRAIFEVEDNTVKQALLKTGIIHEISHELKGALSSKDYRNFEGKMMYDDIKYLIDFVAKTDYGKKKEQFLEEDEVLKIKEQIINAFYKTIDGQRICLFTDKNRFMKKIMNYKYSVNDMVSVVVKKNISDERRREVELRHLEECLSPEDSKDDESVKLARERQKEFFYNLFDPVPKVQTLEDFLSTHIPEDKLEEIQFKKESLFSKYAGILRIRYHKELENKLVLTRKDLTVIRNLSPEELQYFEKMLNINEKKKAELSNTEIKQISMLQEFITNFDSCIKAMYKVMPAWMFEAFYSDKSLVADHALNHSIEVLIKALEIIALDFNRKVDMKTLIYSALLHDVSCTIFRQNHEINSATWARRILQNGTNLSKQEINKICLVGENHKKYKRPLTEEKIRSAHDIRSGNYCYEACLLHDADGLAAVLDFGRVLGVWLAQKDPFINRNLKIFDKTGTEKDRLSLIREGKYLKVDGGDAINDLMRQFYRRNPNFYFTNGARELADKAYQDKQALRKFLDSPEIRDSIETYSDHKYSQEDIDEALEIIDETFATDNLIDDYERAPIEEIGETLTVKTTKSLKKDSAFNLSSKLSILYRILFNLPSHSNIILSDMHGGYNRLSEILIKLLDSTYSIDKIMKIFNNGDLNKDSLTEEDLEEIEETRQKLNKDIISKIKSIKKNIYVLGDMLDRGDKQVETFELMNQISKTGKLKYIMGNHDIYAFMNLLGLHLPFYDNYKGISKNYTVELFNGTKKVNILELLESKRKYGIGIEGEQKDETERRWEMERTRDKKHWARKLYEYMQHADAVQKKWTKEENKDGITKEKELQILFEKTFGSEYKLHEKGKDVLNSPKGIFAQDEELLRFHKKFFGRNVGVVVYTGIRAVNKMSLNWWKDRNEELSNLKRRYPQYAAYWDRLQKEIDAIIEDQQQTLNEKYLSDEWEWLVIDAIMYRNYESTEWNALDWVFHNNWGGGSNGFLAQLNDKIKARLNKEKKAKIRLVQEHPLFDEKRKAEEIEKINEEYEQIFKDKRVTPVNYFDDPLIQELLEFYHSNFYLYRRDHFGNCYMHSILPVDNNGEVSIGHVDKDGVFVETDDKGIREKGFVYKKRRYRNKTILKGLGQIAKDVRRYDVNSQKLSRVMEAFTLLTAIYADNTTRIKPANLKQMKEQFGGFFSILQKMGISTLVVGHNPISKIGTRVELEKLKIFNRELDRQKLTILNTDGEMSSGYQKPFGAGVGIEMSLLGVRYRGFLDGKSETFSGDYTRDVEKEDMRFTILLNIFPSLKKLLLLSEKFYKLISSFGNIREYFNGEILTKKNSTLVMLTTEKQLKEEIERAYLRGISAIAIVPNKLSIFSKEEIIEKSFVTIKGQEISFNVYLNKILAGNGKYMKCLSYDYQKKAEVSNEEIEYEIRKHILEQIKNKQYRKKGIKVSKNILTDMNIDGNLELNKKTIADEMKNAITRSFGILPLLYDLNLQNLTDTNNLTTNINIDKIKDILAAA